MPARRGDDVGTRHGHRRQPDASCSPAQRGRHQPQRSAHATLATSTPGRRPRAAPDRGTQRPPAVSARRAVRSGVPAAARTRAPGRARRRPGTPSCRNRRGCDRARELCPPFCARRFLVGADDRAVEHHLGQRRVPGVAQVLEDALPDAELRPADVQVRRTRPRPEVGRDGPPLGSIAASPDDGLNRQTTASTVWRSSFMGRRRGERTWSSASLSTRHSSSLRTGIASERWSGRSYADLRNEA